MAALRIAVRRFARRWPVWLVLFGAVVVACALFGGTPLYSVAITELGLRRALAAAGPAAGNVLISGGQALDEPLFDEITAAAGPLLAERVIVEQMEVEAQRPRVAEAGEGDRRLGVISVDGAEERIVLVAGRLPLTPTLGTEGCTGAGGCCVQYEPARSVAVPPGPLPFTLPVSPSVYVEAVANADLAAALGLRLGDLVPLAATPNYVLKVVGLGRPADADGAYWTWEPGLFAGPQADFPGLVGGLHVGGQDYRCLAAVSGQPLRLVAAGHLQDHVRVVAGRLPEVVPGGVVEMVAGPRPAAAAGLVPLPTAGQAPLPTAGQAPLPSAGQAAGGRLLADGGLEIRLVGLVEPLDAAEDYWLGDLAAFEGDATGSTLTGLVRPEAIAAAGGERAERQWRLLIDHSQISFANLERVEEVLAALRGMVGRRDPAARVETGLPALIARYRARLAPVRAVVSMVGAAVLAVVVYYLVLMAGLALDQELDELAALVSRGARPRQILGIQLVEGVLVCLPAAAFGPYLAAAALSRAAGAPQAVTAEARALAGAAAGVCLAAMLVPVIPAARRSLAAWRAFVARPPERAAWQRYYLDVFLLLLGGALFWSLRSEAAAGGGPRRLAALAQAGLTADPLSLIAPALLLVAAALVLMRVFPPLLRLAGRAVAATRGAPGAVGVWQVARNPVAYTRLVLLLTLAVALGLLAAVYRDSLAASQEARARLEIGADLRLTWRRPPALSGAGAVRAGPHAGRYAAIDGASAAAAVYREERAADAVQPGGLLLGVQPGSLARVASYAPGSSPFTMAEVLGLLDEDEAAPAPGLPLPGEPPAMGLWLRPVDAASAEIAVQAWLRDAEQQWWTVDLPAPQPGVLDWQYLEAPIASDAGGPPAYPLRWVALSFRSTRALAPTSADYHRARFYLAGAQLASAGGGPAAVDGLADAGRWAGPAEDAGPNRLEFGPAPGDARLGRPALDVRIRFASARPSELRAAPVPARPLPAAVSRRFLDARGLRRGDTFSYPVAGRPVEFVVAGVIARFPGATGPDGAFLIANLDRLMAELSPAPGSQGIAPTEVWIDLADPQDRPLSPAALAGLRAEGTLAEAAALIEEYRAEPLALGLSGALGLVFGVAWGLAAVGLAVYATLTARRRQVELGVLRAVGLSGGQLVRLLLVEHVLVVGLGIAAGTLLGLGVAATGALAPYLALGLGGEAGAAVVRVDWAAVARLYAGLAASLAVVLAAIALFVSRLRLGQVLRLGE